MDTKVTVDADQSSKPGKIRGVDLSIKPSWYRKQPDDMSTRDWDIFRGDPGVWNDWNARCMDQQSTYLESAKAGRRAAKRAEAVCVLAERAKATYEAVGRARAACRVAETAKAEHEAAERVKAESVAAEMANKAGHAAAEMSKAARVAVEWAKAERATATFTKVHRVVGGDV